MDWTRYRPSQEQLVFQKMAALTMGKACIRKDAHDHWGFQLRVSINRGVIDMSTARPGALFPANDDVHSHASIQIARALPASSRSAYARALGFENDVVWVADDEAIARKAKRKNKKKKKKKKETRDRNVTDTAHDNEAPTHSDESCNIDDIGLDVDEDSEGAASDG